MIENQFEKIQKFINTENSLENFRKGKNWSFDLKVGEEYFVSGNNTPLKLTDENPYIIIKPGQFAILETKEKIEIDCNHIALISVKFTFKKRGLINVSGFHVDPCYKGKIIFTVFNAGPNDIYIKKDDYVFMIFFIKLAKSVDIPFSEGYNEIPTDMFAGLGGGTLTLMENNKKIEQLEFYIKFIIVPIAFILLGVGIKYLLK